jgi:AcrR family transcriptional regulator
MPKLKDELKENAIKSAALRLVIETGFSGLKIADVAKAAGIGTGTMYVYYDDKEHLINDLYLHTKREVANVLLDPAHESGNFYETFRKMWMAYFHFCLQQPEKMFFVEQFYYSGFVAEQVKEVTESYFEPLDQFLIQAQELGLIKKVDIKISKAFIQGAIHEVVRVLVKEKRTLQTADMEQCFDMAWGSIRK